MHVVSFLIQCVKLLLFKLVLSRRQTNYNKQVWLIVERMNSGLAKPTFQSAKYTSFCNVIYYNIAQTKQNCH